MSATVLPPELLTKIFRYLSTSDLLLNVARVSHQFHGLVGSPGIYLKVAIPDSFQADDGLVEFFRQATLMTEIHLYRGNTLCINLDGKEEQIISAMVHHEHIKSIIFERWLSSESFLLLAKSKWWEKLEKLDIYVLLERSIYQNLDLAIRKLHNLRVFNLSGLFSRQSRDQYRAVAQANKDTLEEIRVQDSEQWNSEDFNFLIECPKLKTLHCEEGTNVSSVLTKLKNLSSLTLECVNGRDFLNNIPPNSLPLLKDLKIVFMGPNVGTEESILTSFANGCPNYAHI